MGVEARKMFEREDYNIALKHLEHARKLQEEREYAASAYHRDGYLYHLPTQGLA